MVIVLFLLSFLFLACSENSSRAEEELSPVVKISETDSIIVAGSELKSFLQKQDIKLVYRNDVTGNIVYVDFSNEIPTLREFENGMQAYHPEISPDGNWVAFSTTHENSPSKSSLYLFRLDTLEVHLEKLDFYSASIPHWRVLENGDTAIVFVDYAGLTQEDAWSSYATYQVVVRNGKFEIPEKLFNGAFHSGISKEGDFALTGASRFIARKRIQDSTGNISWRDSIWYNDEQVCNVSLAKDDSKKSLFLDMAGKAGLAFEGVRFRPHERILVVDSNGVLIDAFPSPEGFSFDHTEYISEGDFSVATLQDFTRYLAHTKIVLVDMQTKKLLPLVEGEEFYHPYLWVK